MIYFKIKDFAIKETLIKSFVHIAQSDFFVRLTENMQARCANNLMM